MATFKAIVFANHTKKDGTSNIKIRVYHNKKSQYIPTFLFIEPKYMSSSGEISADCPESDMYNYEIGNIIQEYRKFSLKLGAAYLRVMTCSDLKNYLENISNQDNDIIDFVQFANGQIRSAPKEKTGEWYRVSLSALKWYFNKESIEIKELTTNRLSDFMEQLSVRGPKGKPLQPGAINNYIRGLRSLFNKCKLHYNNEDIGIIKIAHDPFVRLKIPQYRRRRKNIGISYLKKIRDGKFENSREQLARDVFMMMFYLMGININDLYCLSEPRYGRVNYERSKTQTEDNVNNFILSIRIESELERLIEKYSPDGFLSAIKTRYSNSYNFMKAVNTGLADICEKLDIPKVTTNWARHTWASLARNKAGISKADIDFCLFVTGNQKCNDFGN